MDRDELGWLGLGGLAGARAAVRAFGKRDARNTSRCHLFVIKRWGGGQLFVKTTWDISRIMGSVDIHSRG